MERLPELIADYEMMDDHARDLILTLACGYAQARPRSKPVEHPKLKLLSNVRSFRGLAAREESSCLKDVVALCLVRPSVERD